MSALVFGATTREEAPAEEAQKPMYARPIEEAMTHVERISPVVVPKEVSVR